MSAREQINLPRRIYHGTSIANVESILKHGIRPRGDAPSNWPEQPSRSDCVYLTTNQGISCGLRNDDADQTVVFEVEFGRLRRRNPFPDEDFVADINDESAYTEHDDHYQQYCVDCAAEVVKEREQNKTLKERPMTDNARQLMERCAEPLLDQPFCDAMTATAYLLITVAANSLCQTHHEDFHRKLITLLDEFFPKEEPAICDSHRPIDQ